MMKPIVFFLLVLCMTVASLGAGGDPKTQIRNAIVQLTGKPNYSWTSVPKSGTPNFQPGPTEGRTEKNGYTYFLVASGTNQIEVVLKGIRGAIKLESEWETAEQLQGERAWIAKRLKGFQTPAAEAVGLLARTGPIKAEGENSYYAPLTERGVKELIAYRNRNAGANNDPQGAKGWVRFWIDSDSVLSKYEFNIQGKILGGEDLMEVPIDLTTRVEIKNVGSTQVQPPDAAKAKLP